MDYGSYLNNIIEKSGLNCLDDSIKLKQDIQRYQNALSILFNKDLLLLIFDRPEIEIKQTKELIRVCKKWYETTRDDRFWSSLIIKKIPRNLSTLKELYSVDNYAYPDPELSSSFHWIFSKNYPLYGHNIPNTLKKFFYAQEIIICGHFKFYYDGLDLLALTRERGVGWQDIIYMKDGISNIKSVNNNYTKEIKYENEEGITWVGQAKYYNHEQYYEMVPHGQGKWTFPDGSILKGDNVALDGIPHGKGNNGVEYFFGHLVTEEFNRKNKRIKVETW
jgi:hypothetical protein